MPDSFLPDTGRNGSIVQAEERTGEREAKPCPVAFAAGYLT